MSLPAQTFTNIQQLITYINQFIIPNGMGDITGLEHNNVENALAQFIVSYTLNSGEASIVTTGGAVLLPAPITIFAVNTPTAVRWGNNVQNEYYIVNATASDAPIQAGFSYVDTFGAVQTAFPSHQAVHIALATNGNWVQVNNLTGGMPLQADPQTLLGRYANTIGPLQEITIGAGLALNSATGVLSAAGSVAGAENGLSLDNANRVVLGQDVGTSPSVAELLDNREIPMAGFSLLMTGAGTLVINHNAASVFQLDVWGTGSSVIRAYSPITPSSSSGAFYYANVAAPTAADQRIGGIAMGTRLASTPFTSQDAFLAAYSSEAFSLGTNQGTYLAFWTTSIAADTPVERWRIDASGQLTNRGATGTSTIDLTVNNLGAGISDNDGMVFANYTAATALAPVQGTPEIRFHGSSWNTADTRSDTFDWRMYVAAIEGTSTDTTSSQIMIDINNRGAGYLNMLSIESVNGSFLASFQGLWGATGMQTGGINFGNSQVSLSTAEIGVLLLESFAGGATTWRLYNEQQGSDNEWADMGWTNDTNIFTIQVFASGTGTLRYLALPGPLSLGTIAAPTALLFIGAGTATAGTAPIKLNAGTVLGTPEAGTIEYNGTDFFMTAVAARATILGSLAVTASVLNTVTDKVEVVVGGTTYYLLATTSPT